MGKDRTDHSKTGKRSSMELLLAVYPEYIKDRIRDAENKIKIQKGLVGEESLLWTGKGGSKHGIDASEGIILPESKERVEFLHSLLEDDSEFLFNNFVHNALNDRTNVDEIYGFNTFMKPKEEPLMLLQLLLGLSRICSLNSQTYPSIRLRQNFTPRLKSIQANQNSQIMES